MKKVLIIAITFFMFFFKNTAVSNYEKVFFDFNIKSISGDIIDLKEWNSIIFQLIAALSVCQNYYNMYQYLLFRCYIKILYL